MHMAYCPIRMHEHNCTTCNIVEHVIWCARQVHKSGHVASHQVTLLEPWAGDAQVVEMAADADNGCSWWKAAAALSAGTLLIPRRPLGMESHSCSAAPTHTWSPRGTYHGTLICLVCMLTNKAVNIVTQAQHVYMCMCCDVHYCAGSFILAYLHLLPRLTTFVDVAGHAVLHPLLTAFKLQVCWPNLAVFTQGLLKPASNPVKGQAYH